MRFQHGLFIANTTEDIVHVSDSRSCEPTLTVETMWRHIFKPSHTIKLFLLCACIQTFVMEMVPTSSKRSTILPHRMGIWCPCKNSSNKRWRNMHPKLIENTWIKSPASCGSSTVELYYPPPDSCGMSQEQSRVSESSHYPSWKSQTWFRVIATPVYSCRE